MKRNWSRLAPEALEMIVQGTVALIHEGHAGSDNEIREWMSGNICRCGAYPNIVAAVRDAAQGA